MGTGFLPTVRETRGTEPGVGQKNGRELLFPPVGKNRSFSGVGYWSAWMRVATSSALARLLKALMRK